MAITLGADDKKKIYILGALLGVLGLGGLVLVLRPSGNRDASAPANSALGNSVSSRVPTSGQTGAPVLPPGSRSSNFGATTLAAQTATASTVDPATLTPQIPGIGRTRDNPFLPVTLTALPPTPTPAPPPPIRRIVRDAVPVSLPPFSPPSLGTGANLPLNSFPPGAQNNVASTTLYLPAATIFGGTQRAEPAPLPQIGGLTVGAPGAQTEATNASGKRVAGVIVGDTIRALIEYQENGQTVSKIVQPGDEVGGMKILSIQRVRSGEQSIIRVTASENGQEEYFDLGPGS